jgi:D-alanine-D-alanine ligase
MAKRVFEAEGIRTAEGKVMDFQTLHSKGAGMAYPVVVKPTDDGSSVGVAICNTPEEVAALDYKSDAILLIERYIPGRDIQVAVLGDEALGAIEIKPHKGFYDYEAKYTDGKAQHLMPAPLPPEKYNEVLALGLKAHQALGCRGLSRTDFRYDDTNGGDGNFYILETNTQPGMTPLSLAPEIAAYRGIDFASLVHKLVETATLDR